MSHGTILRADYIQDALEESAYRRATHPFLYKVSVGAGRDLHQMVVGDPFHGFIPGVTAPLPRCRQEAYCVSRNNPGVEVFIESLDRTIVSRYVDGMEV